ncbi:Alpha/beta knot methyltransferase [Pelagophyceae sp. CCMP2097]|nr:Alpha/beta knot methyltransferase [Pelagophyceae sp. CCMP2097]|mmetsp:Transcript_31710/g.106831  ORF Transcript_31710/g.106831 Transcript_31710/m.106831 type:complete len:165 (+) Transcript_31710:159-653(+)
MGPRCAVRFAALCCLSFVSALYKIEIHIAGRATGPKDWESVACGEYVTRLRGQLDVSTTWYKSGENLEAAISKLDGAAVLCLDPYGKECSSEAFAQQVFDKLEAGGSRLHFVIGPAAGLPESMRSKATLVSLSQLTFPHQIARVLLIEQIYRAHEIRRGSAYHK